MQLNYCIDVMQFEYMKFSIRFISIFFSIWTQISIHFVLRCCWSFLWFQTLQSLQGKYNLAYLQTDTSYEYLCSMYFYLSFITSASISHQKFKWNPRLVRKETRIFSMQLHETVFKKSKVPRGWRVSMLVNPANAEMPLGEGCLERVLDRDGVAKHKKSVTKLLSVRVRFIA